MRGLLIAGNWKMHGTREHARCLTEAVAKGVSSSRQREVLICPPFVYLIELAELLHGHEVSLGAQDVCDVTPDGAYTGEVSAGMLRDCGCRYVIVGHSERRALYGESDTLVARKFLAAQAAGLAPILCVGESLTEREHGDTESVVLRQLEAVLAAAGVSAFGQAVVAYEPVWAIGTGRIATPNQAQDIHARIRARISRDDAKIAAGLRVIYGGSVKASTAGSLFPQPDIDGALVGGASLDAGEFLAICGAADASETI